jgi:lipid II:glycine glycyltransferase (peptidoglycan interpeptide bridge formation enzyme)
MQIAILSKNYETKYEDFVLKHTKSLFYYQLSYRNLLKELLKCEDEYYILLINEEIKAVLPLLYKDGKYGKVYNSLAYYGANGAILSENELYYNELLKHYNKIIEKSAVSTYVENPLDIHHQKPNHDYVSERVCLINDLENIKNEDELMNKFDSVRRRNIRKAIKENIIVTIDNSDNAVDFLHKVHNENMSAIGAKVKSKVFFQSVKKYFIENKDFNIYIAKYNDEPIGALLVFYFNNIVEYYTPVIVEEFRNKQPLALLIKESMKDSIDKEFLYYNWGGNGLGLSSVYDFKKKWGAEDYKYNYYIKVNNKNILYSNAEELSKYYNNFFVVPFDELKTEDCNDEN